MKKILLLFGLFTAMITLSGCNFSKISPDTIIKVNGEAITKKDFNETFDKYANNSVLSQMGIDLRQNPDNFVHLSIKQKVINELIVKKLLENEIKSRNIKVSQNDMEKEYALLIEKIGSKEKFNELLKQNNITQSTLKNDIKEGLKIQKLVDTLGIVNVSDNDVKKYYKENIKLFQYPDKVKVSHILISADPVQIKDLLLAKEENKNLNDKEIDNKIKEEMELKLKKAKEIQKQAKLDISQFAKLAKENSDDTISAQDGGDLGYVSKEELQEDFAKVAFSQKPNIVSEITITPYGYHIILVTDRVKAGIEPLDNIKFELKNFIEQQKKAELLQKFITNIKTNANIEYIDKSYDIDEITKKIIEIQKKNPSLIGNMTANE